MRIAFISYWSCPRKRLGILSSGGMNVYLFNLANQLVRKNVQVDIFTPSHVEKHDSVIYLSKKICLIHLPVNANNDYSGSSQFAGEILHYISDKKIIYDAIHAHYFFSGLTAVILKKVLKIPFIQTFHTLGEMKKKYLGVIDSRRISAEKEITLKADGLISSTSLEKKDLLVKYNADPGKIFIANPGVDHNIFKPLEKENCLSRLNLSNGYKYILFVGRLDPVKGIDLLLESVYSLTKGSSDFNKKFKLLIIGGDLKNRNFRNNNEVNKIADFIINKKLSATVEFLGSKQNSELPLYYSCADLVVMPSVYESFGLVILEAMACGSAVLASSVGGLKYLVKDNFNGQLFKNGSITDLTEKISNLLMDDNKRKYLGQNAFKTSQKFSWEKQAAKMLSLYREFI